MSLCYHRWHFSCIVACALIISLGISQGVAAQDFFPVLIGPTGTLRDGSLDGEAPVYAGSADCGVFSSEGATSSQLGIRGIAPSFFSDRIGLSLALTASSSTLRFTSRPETGLFVPDPETGKVIETPREFQLEYVSEGIGLQLLGTVKVTEGFYVAAGPSLMAQTSGIASQTDHLTGSDHISFADGQPVRTMTEGATYTATPLLASGIIAGYGLLPLSGRLSLFLEASGEILLTSPVQEADWKTMSGGGSLGLMVVFNSRKQNVEERPSDPSPPLVHTPSQDTIAPPLPALQASIELYGVDAANNRQAKLAVHFEEIDRRMIFRIPHRIPFERAASFSDMPHNNRDLFSFDSLLQSDNHKADSWIWSFLGSRLSEDETAYLSINIPDDLEERQPLQQVQTWMVEEWELSANQVRVGRVSTSEEKKNGLLLEGKPSSLFAPVEQKSITQNFETPGLKVSTSHRADAGLKEWSILLKNGDEIIAHSSSAEREGKGSSTMNWQLLNRSDHPESSMITGIFEISDSVGSVSIDSAAIPLIVRRSFRRVDRIIDPETNVESIVYFLPGQRNDDAAYELAYRATVTQILQDLRNDSRLWIDSSALTEEPMQKEELGQQLTAALRERGGEDSHPLRLIRSSLPPTLLEYYTADELEEIVCVIRSPL